MLKSYFQFISVIIFVFFNYGNCIQAQNGPGGVGNTDGASNLRLWYDANNEIYLNEALVSNVSDKSGYSNTLIAAGAEQPTFESVTPTANGMSSFVFDGNNELESTYNGNSNENMSFFTVLKYTSAAELDVVIQHGGRNTLGFDAVHKYTDNVGGSANVSALSSSSNWEIHAKTFANSGVNRLKYFVNNTNTDNFTHLIENNTSNTWIGGNGSSGVGTKFAGSIAEVIKYTTTINTAQNIIISNYLSAKYNIALANNDYYDADTSGENFDYNVAGIGQAADGSNHLDAQGTGIIRISNPTNIGNNRFLFWGENTKDANYTFSSDASTQYIERLDTKWRVSKSGNLGTFTVRVNASDINFNSSNGCNQLQLVVDNSSDFSSPNANDIYTFTLSGGIYTATGVTLNDNRYFTLQYVDKIVLDDGQFYNGTGSGNGPSISDDCYKLLVKNTADGSIMLTENAKVREIEIETGGKLVLDTGIYLQPTSTVQLNGELRLTGTSQLLQEHDGLSLVTGTGKLLVDQNSEVASSYLYNYFSSPVVTLGQTAYTVASVMHDGTTATSAVSIPLPINFIGGYDGNFTGSPIEIPDYWIYTYDDIGAGVYAYDNNSEIGSTKMISPGKGYLFKGPGRAQNYTFAGTPNDGDYSYTGLPAGVSILVGNPYPSAINVQKFLFDNSSIGNTIYLWQHAGVLNAQGNQGHFSTGYVGGYATINTATSTKANAPTQISTVLKAEVGILGGGATFVNNKVLLAATNQHVSFEFNSISKAVNELVITYSSLTDKKIDIDVNGINQFNRLTLPSTGGILTTESITLSISPNDVVLLKSRDTNTCEIQQVSVKQNFTYLSPPFNYFTVGQAFFFEVSTAGDLVFNNSQRAFIPEGSNGSFLFKDTNKKSNDLPVIKLGMDYSPIVNQTYHRQIAISFKAGNSFAFDAGFDSAMSDKGTTDVYWKFPNDDNPYIIAGVQQIDENLEVPLEIIIKDTQTVTIGIDELQNITMPIYLKDKITNQTYNLTNTSVNLNLQSGLHKDRFYIVFKDTTLALENTILSNSFTVYHNREMKELVIKNNSNSTLKKVTVYTILGQKIIEIDDVKALNEQEVLLKSKALSSAIYLVTLETSEGKISKKIL